MRVSPVRRYPKGLRTPGIVVVGGDPSVANYGLAAARMKADGGFEVLGHTVIRTSPSDPDKVRMKMIFKGTSQMIREHHGVIFASEEQRSIRAGKEKAGGQSNADNAKTLISAGVAGGAAFAYGAEWIEVRTGSVRTVMGKDKPKPLRKGEDKSRQKREIQRWVEVVTGVHMPFDAAEAMLNAMYVLLNERKFR